MCALVMTEGVVFAVAARVVVVVGVLGVVVVVVVVPDDGPGPVLSSKITEEPLGTATGFEVVP